MQPDVTTVNCPQCQKEVIWDNLSPWRPFCSKRCQMIDLGEWAAEEKSIAGQPTHFDHEAWSEQDSES
ncbi:DNA gyrase inhibitor YacG [Rosenbergiella collisarenosi]|uniref:DNA gyrase inhibitor YacG n=1 Tax=Rosenbergiella collisarenosi TaxID=1544695 RepID=UPI001F4D81C6|nr:DNA gyrase inhibitor YacG [Rosenbergiella collisarenosi]